MEQEKVTVILTVSQWNAILAALSTAPFQIVNQISEAVGDLQGQAGPQIAELQKKYPEAAAAE